MTRKRHVVLLGSHSVGKSSLVRQFIDNTFSSSYCPTIETTSERLITYRNKEFLCHITDTGGQDSCTPMNPRYAIGTHGYILVYSIESRDSFTMVKLLHEKILDFWGLRRVPCLIIGNKSDLNESRRVSSIEGHTVASELNCVWMEASSKDYDVVAECFRICLLEIEACLESQSSTHQLPRTPGWRPLGSSAYLHVNADDDVQQRPSSLIRGPTEAILRIWQSLSLPTTIAPAARFTLMMLRSQFSAPSSYSSQHGDSDRDSATQPSALPLTILGKPLLIDRSVSENAINDEEQSHTLRNSTPAFIQIFRRSSQIIAESGSEGTLIEEESIRNDDKDFLGLLSDGRTALDVVRHAMQTFRNAQNKKDLPPTLHRIFSFISQDKLTRQSLMALKGDDAQIVLDALQWLLDWPRFQTVDNTAFLRMLLRLSKHSGLIPTCLILKDVTRENDFAVTAGHFGEIWKGGFRGRSVCLKVVKVYQKSHIEHLLKVFTKEAILWCQLSHPNVLPFYGIYHLGDEQGRICLVSPWMGRGNVRDYLPNDVDVDRLLLIRDVAKGLCYLHEQGIVHGDLKGVNILISNSRRACLADFGLANLVDSEMLRWTSTQSTGHQGGTVRWQAPELFNPDDESAKPSKESDVYSFACVCYEIFTNEVPFYEVLREPTVIANVMMGKRPCKPASKSDAFVRWGLTNTMWTLMETCWHRQPHMRPTIGGILNEGSLDTVTDRRPEELEDRFSPRDFRNAMYNNEARGSSRAGTPVSKSSRLPTNGWFRRSTSPIT